MSTVPELVGTGRRRFRETPLALVMLGPSIVLFAVFVFYPLGRTVWLGLRETKRSAFNTSTEYVGFSQYWDVLTSDDFHHSMWVTLKFGLLTVPLGLVFGLALALLADRYVRGIGFFRTIFSSTVATSVAVASLMWLVLLNPSIGLLTTILPFDALKTPGLLGRESTALFAVSLTTVWQSLGFTFIVLTAGLQSIPNEQKEAALIDGAGPWQRFTGVILPGISPTLLFVSTVLTINAFQSFGQIDILTKGGPPQGFEGETRVIVYEVYDRAFGTARDLGRGSATAAILFVVVVVVTFVQFKLAERRVFYR